MPENKIGIAVINRSSVVSDEEVQAVVAALQIQVDRDFCPIWGTSVDLGFCGVNDLPPDNLWWLVILDDSDTAGALGYHDMTNTGLPLGKVFAKTDKDYNLAWSVTASHELLEMLEDPEINTTAFDQTSETTGTLYAYEVADPCEDDQFAYEIETDGGHKVMVSDFITPDYFVRGLPEGTKYDFQGKISAPFQLLDGGYYSTFEVNGSGWKQVFGANVPEHKLVPPRGSRRERRARGGWRKFVASNVVTASTSPSAAEASA